MIVGLVASTGRAGVERAIASLADCDEVVVVDDTERRGQAWTRNRLLELAPPGSLVRYVDDDDVAMSSQRAGELLRASGADVLGFSFISGQVRETVPSDPLAAAIDSVGPWSWIAQADALRAVPWDPRRTTCTGTWHWLAMIDAGLRFAFAPDLWGYHWLRNSSGVTATASADTDLFAELRGRITAAGRDELLLPLIVRMSRAGLPVDQVASSVAARFKATFGRYPNVVNPTTFSEKIAWRKLFDRSPIFATWSDKLRMRAWAAGRLGEDIAPRLLAIAGELDTVPPITVPHVMKANHGSGWFARCSPEEFGGEAWRARALDWLRRSYGADRGEWHYETARRLILVEEDLPAVRDVRLFTFGGRVACFYVDSGNRTAAHRLDFYSRENAHLDVRLVHRNDPAATRLDDSVCARAIALAEHLAEGFDFVRVDLLESAGRLYFGELTPVPGSGNLPFSPSSFDAWLGSHWQLPQRASVASGLSV